jgi:hypothetical protein
MISNPIQKRSQMYCIKFLVGTLTKPAPLTPYLIKTNFIMWVKNIKGILRNLSCYKFDAATFCEATYEAWKTLG